MKNQLSRRSFIGNTTLASAALATSSLFAANINAGTKKLKCALIGCGGRGKGAVQNFKDACKLLGIEATLVATADAFKDKAVAIGKRHGLSEDKCYGGFDAYQKALESDADFVLMATPPGFRPLHFAAAIEAGKHCFIEKPVAVDPVGARSIIATGEIAKKKGLAVVTGTQRRHTSSYRKNKALIDAGAIGDIKGGVVQWNGRIPWIKRRKEGESEADYMARNWLNFTELSGDHIVEQHVHNIDVCLWYLGKLPVSVLGFGGRARRETGNQFDFFSVDLDFGDSIHVHSQCRQLAGCYNRVGEVFTGTHGSCFGGGKLTGKKVDIPEIKQEHDSGLIQEHVDMIKSVIKGEPLNEARQIAESTMVAIMGRISAYTGKLVRWTDVMENERSPFYNYSCSPTSLAFEKGEVKMPVEKPPVPGA